MKHQKALPTIVFKKIWRNKLSQKNIALSELITGALFFGMRSCEYSTTSGKRKTKKLEVKDIYFYLGRKEIKKTKGNLHSLHSATSVSVTFTLQKNNQRYATITQHRSGNEVDPVSLWAALVKGILSYKTRSLSSPVYLYMSDTGEIRNISLKDVAAHLKAMVSALGENYLGFTSEYVGTHSIRLSFAMMLKLKGIHPSTIMLQGLWSSDAFMKYIRPQIQQFSIGLSSVMVEDDFFTVPATDQRSHENDPESSPNGPLSASSPFYGPLSNRTSLARAPVFDVCS